MRNKNIQYEYFDDLGIIGLLFCFCQFFADVALSLTR